MTSINKVRPDFVCFVCTGRDPESGRPGSISQITGKGNVISKRVGGKLELPNIPTQAGLEESQFETLKVPADDLDQAFVAIHDQLADLHSRYPQAGITADYTGGTKTMTAALVTAVLETGGVGLQLVTGARADLVKVADETQYALAANVQGIRLQRSMASFLGAWRRFAYDEAGEGLQTLEMPRDSVLRAHLSLARNLSRAFAAWDRFDHAAALEALAPFRSRVGKSLGLHLKTLKLLREDDDRRVPLQIFDLWLNAKRRAVQGRYDDAVARVYRLIEWTAQWQLKSRAGIDTSDVLPEKIPEGIELTKNRDGKYQAGLFQAWMLIERLLDGCAQEFIRDHHEELLHHLDTRNRSILAHGFTPVDRGDWKRLEDWMEAAFVPVLAELARTRSGIRFDMSALQLPAELPRENPN
ncbi:MAG: TIGR02710 family CRISPR-associated CARF protein [Pseudomonadota bacterium]